MSKSSLALLDRAVQGAVAHELGDGNFDTAALAELGIAPERRRTVAGMRVISNAARDAEVSADAAKMTDKLLRYRADRALVIDKLKRVDVKPVAVLPLTAWNRICDSTGLYRFLPQGDSVRMDAAVLLKRAADDVNKTWRKQHDDFMLKAWGVYIGVETLLFLLGYFVGWGFYIPAGVGIFPGALFMGLSSSEGPIAPIPKEMEAKRIRELVAEHEKNGTLLKELWPDLREPEKGSNIRIALPEPPAEVQERLIAAERARLPLNIAVVGDAIMFKEPIADVLVGIRTKHWEEVERQEALRLDPIAYVVEGSAVAIIDQYGKFPIEQAVMNQVINSEHLV